MHGCKENIAEEITIVAERVSEQRIVEVGHALRTYREIFHAIGYHEDLAEGKSHTLPQRIGELGRRAVRPQPGHTHGAPPPCILLGVIIDCSRIRLAFGPVDKWLELANRTRELVVDPSGQPPFA
jgi:hypothetical protein